MKPRMKPQVPRFHVLTSGENARSHERIAALAAQGGAELIQFRGKNLSIRETIRFAEKARAAALKHGALFIVNDRADAALAVNAHGVHLGQSDLPARAARQILGENALIGVTAPTPELARQAADDGADYLGYGPIFGTQSKPDARPPVGLDALRTYARAAPLPVIAIGGIEPSDIPGILDAGAHGAAALSAVCGADDAEQAARAFADMFPKR